MQLFTEIASPVHVDGLAQKNSRANGEPPDIQLENLVGLSDEALCQNARSGCAASRELLWHRHQRFIQNIVRYHNRRQGLPSGEIADALQESYFAFFKTVRRYQPQPPDKEKSASFKTFLGLLVVQAFSKYCTRWRKYHRRVVLTLEDDDGQSGAMSTEENWPLAICTGEPTGGAAATFKDILLIEFSSDKLIEVIRRLKPREKNLLEIWLQYGRDKEVAHVFGISPTAARLRRERLFHRIRQSANGQ